MTVLLALAAAFGSQETADDLRKEVERLRRENQALDQAVIENAQTIQRLRSAIKALEARLEASEPKANGGVQPPPPAGAQPPGPAEVIRAKVEIVNPEYKFLIIGKGKKDGIKVGYRFEITREVREGEKPPAVTRLGAAEVEKFVGMEDSMAKLIVVEGKVDLMKPYDDATALRALPPLPAPEKAKEPPRPGVYRITGRVGRPENTGYTIDFGGAQGAALSQILYFYRDTQLACRIRLDAVNKDFSVGRIVDHSLVGPPPEIGDDVHVRELRKAALAGTVALSDEKRGLIAVSLRRQDGMRPGMRCQVTRAGKKIATLVVTDVQVWGSWARIEGDAKIEDLQKNDFVEVLEEK
jgi:hypothetical protein